MNFTPLASSSRGNAYLLESPGVTPLLLEAGVPIKQLREKLHFGVTGLAGCLVSHEHMDHAKAVKDLLKAGVDCYMSEGTAKALGVEGHHRVTHLYPTIGTFVGDWYVYPFPLEHDAAEPFGFAVRYMDAGFNHCVLFIPDTAYIQNRFQGVTILAIEANNVEEILSRNIVEGVINEAHGRRVRRNHMSLERVISMIKANDLSRCRAIHLLHLSDDNSDEARMVRTVQEATGIPTYASQS